MAMLDGTTDRTTDGAMPGCLYVDAPGRREWPRPGDLADPPLFDFAGLAADAAMRHNDPENP